MDAEEINSPELTGKPGLTWMNFEGSEDSAIDADDGVVGSNLRIEEVAKGLYIATRSRGQDSIMTRDGNCVVMGHPAGDGVDVGSGAHVSAVMGVGIGGAVGCVVDVVNSVHVGRSVHVCSRVDCCCSVVDDL